MDDPGDRARNVALAHTVLDMSYNEADLAKAIASVRGWKHLSYTQG